MVLESRTLAATPILHSLGCSMAKGEIEEMEEDEADRERELKEEK